MAYSTKDNRKPSKYETRLLIVVHQDKMTIFVTRADEFRPFLECIRETVCRVNVSHHMQYLEFLYKVKKLHDPKLTTLSLINKTIIVEYFTVIEAILDDLLCQIQVTTPAGNKDLELSEYTRADDLFGLAKHYGVIDTTTHSRLGQLKTVRNRIHIKRYRKNRGHEHKEYTQTMLKEHEAIFKDFMLFLLKRHCPDKADVFPWPWNAQV